jgi:hypothetical protein
MKKSPWGEILCGFGTFASIFAQRNFHLPAADSTFHNGSNSPVSVGHHPILGFLGTFFRKGKSFIPEPTFADFFNVLGEFDAHV